MLGRLVLDRVVAAPAARAVASGLRLGEALELHWSDERCLTVDFDGEDVLLVFAEGTQKNRKVEESPTTPDFAEFLRSVKDREGYVFNPTGERHKRLGGRRLSLDYVSRVIGRIGKAAGVVVKPAASDDAEPTYASAHDLRRSFAERWSHRVEAATLMALMRHGSIATTMKFYAKGRAKQAAKAARLAMNRSDAAGNAVDSSAKSRVACVPQTIEEKE